MRLISGFESKKIYFTAALKKAFLRKNFYGFFSSQSCKTKGPYWG